LGKEIRRPLGSGPKHLNAKILRICEKTILRLGHEVMLICDLTQSWSATAGGGVGTYLREKQRYFIEHSPARLLRIVPGAEDKIERIGDHIFAEVAAPKVPGSPHYRFILNTKKVHALLQEYRPDIIESHCPWVLPWVAINHRRKFPETGLVAAYHTDFPNVHVHRVLRPVAGERIAERGRRIAYGHMEKLYNEFDWLYVLNKEMQDDFADHGLKHSSVMSFGVDTSIFSPNRHDANLRTHLGLKNNGPLLIYAGRIDVEKRADLVADAFRLLPADLGASLIMVGDGKLRARLMTEFADKDAAFPGFVRDRSELARLLSSCDIYVSGMADETFGISIIEAQSSGLPVVGVKSGAMPDRIVTGTGLLGEAGNAAEMAANIQSVWASGAKAMGQKARAHVDGRYSWDQSVELLFSDVYPNALKRRDARIGRAQA
jgi:alpha-1,6-mannosyltransferase